MTPRKILTIVRARWARGGRPLGHLFGATRLLNEQGNRCCLGFDAAACGVPDDVLLNKLDPESLTLTTASRLPAAYWGTRLTARGRLTGYVATNTPAVKAAIRINDDPQLTDTEREARLVPVLQQLGWDEVRFVDEAPSAPRPEGR